MFPPNLDPQVYALSATIIGAVISSELNRFEALTDGNWLVLVGEYLRAYAGQVTLIESRECAGQVQSINMNAIIDALKRMEWELEKLKKETL